MQVVIDGSQAHAHAIRDLSAGLPPPPSHTRHQRDNMVIDAAGQYAYVLTGQRVCEYTVI